jgi:hypothetical protein
MIVRIFDRKERLLISLLSLIQLLRVIVPAFMNINWKLTRARSGHGENVCRLEDQLDANKTVEISMEALVAWLTKGEYFSSVNLVSESNDLSFGAEDSTYLYVETENQELIEAVKSAYEKVQIY